MPINRKELTEEMLKKAVACKTADELIALAKSGGLEITKDEAEAYLAELADIELDEIALQKIAGGSSGCFEDESVPFLWTRLHPYVGS